MFGVSEELPIVEVFSCVCIVDELHVFSLESSMCSCIKLVTSWHPCKCYTGEFIAFGKHWFVDNHFADIFASFYWTLGSVAYVCGDQGTVLFGGFVPVLKDIVGVCSTLGALASGVVDVGYSILASSACIGFGIVST